jgi:predicted ATP-dependent serine protease
MIAKSHSAKSPSVRVSAPVGPVASGNYTARAFSGGSPLVVGIQASVRFRDGRQRASLVASGVPTARVRQILMSALALDAMEYVTPEVLRVDVHRPDAGRYEHDYGLAVAVAMVSSLVRRPVADHLLFLGDVDLHGRLGNVLAARVDRLNDAINA